MRLALFATMVLLLTLVASDTALACNCFPLSPAESFKNADVVFEGELLGITRLPPASRYSLAYRFKVRKAVKGWFGNVVSVFGDGTDCDPFFAPGFVYRVYAD